MTVLYIKRGFNYGSTVPCFKIAALRCALMFTHSRIQIKLRTCIFLCAL